MTTSDLAPRQAMLDLAAVLTGAGQHAEARRVVDTPLNSKTYFACAFRTLRAVEQSVMLSWGATKFAPGPRADAVEAVLLARLVFVRALAGTIPADVREARENVQRRLVPGGGE